MYQDGRAASHTVLTCPVRVPFACTRTFMIKTDAAIISSFIASGTSVKKSELMLRDGNASGWETR